jgi:hypothetical protein
MSKKRRRRSQPRLSMPRMVGGRARASVREVDVPTIRMPAPTRGAAWMFVFACRQAAGKPLDWRATAAALGRRRDPIVRVRRGGLAEFRFVIVGAAAMIVGDDVCSVGGRLGHAARSQAGAQRAASERRHRCVAIDAEDFLERPARRPQAQDGVGDRGGEATGEPEPFRPRDHVVPQRWRVRFRQTCLSLDVDLGDGDSMRAHAGASPAA